MLPFLTLLSRGNYMDISQHTRTRGAVTPQSAPLPGRESEQVPNSAGGFTFVLDKWKQLERFLILGTEGGTYYVGEKDLTKTNHDNLLACIAEDAKRVLVAARIVSLENRAPKNDYAIYATALVAAKASVVEDRQLAWVQMRDVCRIGTHLFQFIQFYTAFKGWSRMSRNGVAKWYTERSPDSLAYQLLKYQSRNGWAHRDVIRLAHVKPKEGQSALIAWAVNGVKEDVEKPVIHPLIDAHFAIHNRVKMLPTHLPLESDLRLIKEHRLTHEMLPTELLKSPQVWEALLPQMGAHALIRSLARMTSIGMLEQFGDGVQAVTAKLTDAAFLKSNRVHPFAMLLALAQYGQGRGDKGSLTWSPNPRIMDALSAGLELSFNLVEPTGKRILHALDVSGSMQSSTIANSRVNCTMAESVMALVSIKNEPKAEVIAFDKVIRELPFTYNTSLSDAVRLASEWHGGRTDCAQPMLYAAAKKWVVDAFVIWTDNETWAGSIHPVQALAQYRREFNPKAKMIVCGMTSTGFTISDPSDAGCLDVVGMDSSVPSVISGMLKE